MSPREEAVAIVRANMHAVRVWLGEITEEQHTYQPKHIEETP